MNDILYFKEVPATWEHYLPLGNGRLGAMVKTHPCNEIIQLNEEGIWSGGPIDRVNPDSQNYLEEVRELVKQGKVMEAQELGFQTLSGTSFNERVYQTAGDFKIDFFSSKNYGIECGFPLNHKSPKECLDSYISSLNLAEASTKVTYTDDEGVEFCRTSWISAPDDMFFMYVTASEKGKINFRGYLDRGIWTDGIYAKDGFIFLEDSHGIPFCLGAGVVCNGGESSTTGFCLTGKNCDEALFFIDIQAWKWDGKKITRTEYDEAIKNNSWSGLCYDRLLKLRQQIQNNQNNSKNPKNGLKQVFEAIYEKHVKEYQSYWKRMEVHIGNDNAKDDEKTCPIPELLKKASVENIELVNYYINFDRYLLISASRKPGILPSTLQGLWNCYMDPPWGSKYTVNINTEMNYWPVNMAGLSECELPLFNLLERAYENGCDVAKRMYGCKGYVIHHNLDFWGDSAPQDNWLPGTYWVLGAAWLATHIWEHYEYTQDKDFLRCYYYLMHEACLFFVDFLQPCDLIATDGKPYLVINPSVSPENSYVTKAGQVGAFCEGCEMDNMILEHIFSSCLKAKELCESECLDKAGNHYNQKDFDDFDYVLKHLKKPGLNKDGSLMEWNTEVEEVEPGHRHISHLYGLFPGHTIAVKKDADGKDEVLVTAAKKTLEKRLSHGGGHTGWSQAWIINFYAQLGMGDEALSAIVKLLSHSTLPNLLDNHPPFQIDGNYGAYAAIIRMLVQSEIMDSGQIAVKLLPALPAQKEWQNGYVRGVKIKGGYSLDFDWKDGKALNLHITPAADNIVFIE